MATYKIVGSYRILEVEANPDVVVEQAPNNNSFTFSVSTVGELSTLILNNTQAFIDSATQNQALHQEIKDAID